MILTSITNVDRTQFDLLGRGVNMNPLGLTKEELLFIQKVTLITSKYGCKVIELDSETRYLDIWCPDDLYESCILELEKHFRRI